MVKKPNSAITGDDKKEDQTGNGHGHKCQFRSSVTLIGDGKPDAERAAGQRKEYSGEIDLFPLKAEFTQPKKDDELGNSHDSGIDDDANHFLHHGTVPPAWFVCFYS